MDVENVAARRRPRRAGVLTGFVLLLLTACAGPPPVQVAHDDTTDRATEQQPVPAGTGAEKPGAPRQKEVAFVPAAPGDGNITVDDDEHLTACMYYHWPSTAPALGDGLTFEPSGVELTPGGWRIGSTSCGDDDRRCSEVTLADDQASCWWGFVRDEPAGSSEHVTATAKGTARCVAPRTEAACAEILADLVHGDGASLDFPPGTAEPPSPEPGTSPDETSTSPDQTEGVEG